MCSSVTTALAVVRARWCARPLFALGTARRLNVVVWGVLLTD
ncbi:hypothetical protein ACTXG6_17060 [Pseudonocardia sp. Cha107L01]